MTGGCSLFFSRRREGTLEVPTFVAAEDQSAVSQATLHTWTMRFFVQIGSQNLWLTMGFSIGEVDGGGLFWFFRLNWG